MEQLKAYSNAETSQIAANFRRLNDCSYLDHAGATQYAEQQIRRIYDDLASSVYANPHTSKFTEDLIDQVRYKILSNLNATSKEYSVIFTSGTTASLKLLAETFDFAARGCFAYLRDNHTSVLGMREIVRTENIHCIERQEFLNDNFDGDGAYEGRSLYVYPAQCNFNGFKYPLDKIHRIQTNNDKIRYGQLSERYVCLDAACFVSTNYLDLTRWQPDFVCLSFYKMFGYPTGLGALIVSKRGEEALNKRYYGGGTVKISLSNSSGWHRKRDTISERFEDGTIPFLSIISLLAGYETIEQLIPGNTLDRISQHCFNLAKHLYDALIKLKYSNGRPVVHFYHDNNFTSSDLQGGIVNFNVLKEDGSFVGFAEVDCMAKLHNIQFRTGCFCNPGACQRHLGLTDFELKKHFKAGHICGDDFDLIDGQPTGSIRISMGYMTTYENVNAVIQLIESCYINKERPIITKSIENHLKNDSHNKNGLINGDIHNGGERIINGKDQCKENVTLLPEPKKAQVKLQEICIYPVKSCAPFRIASKWPLNSRGFVYDREWMIVKSSGVAMTQKSDTKLCLIQPVIDQAKNLLTLTFPYADSMSIALKRDVNDKALVSFCQSKVCGDRIDGIDCGDDVAEWLSDVLVTPGLRLIQQNLTDVRTAKNDRNQAISLSNQAQFLLINVASVDWLAQKVDDWTESNGYNENVLQNTIDRFRANLIIDSSVPLDEMNWTSIRVGDAEFNVVGPCTRCQMICIDQSTGERTTEPLQTIAREFQGKMRFGIYLCQSNTQQFNAGDCEVSCGDNIIIVK